MKYLKFIVALLVCTSCADNESKTVLAEKQLAKPDSFIDTSYKFADTSKERIAIAQTSSANHNFHYVQFNYFRKAVGKWNLIHSFDSLAIWGGFEPDHKDLNGDGIKDFVFLAGTGGRGADYFQHILLFDSSTQKFRYIKRSDEVCAPDFDTAKKMLVGTGMSGAYQDTRYYLFDGDSIVQKSGEVWKDDSLIRKYRLVKGKEIIDKTVPK